MTTKRTAAATDSPDGPDSIGDELTAWGRAATLETTGRVTGRVRRAAVGFVDEPDGSIIVAAGTPETDWAVNLLAEPACRVTIGGRTFDGVAEALAGPDAAAAIRALILRHGTPAERLGRGPSFRIRPVRKAD